MKRPSALAPCFLLPALLFAAPSELQPSAHLYPQDESFRHLSEAARARGLALTDYHIHIRGGMTPEKAAERHEASGVRSTVLENLGREWPLSNNVALAQFIDACSHARAGGQRLPVGVQVNDRDWHKQIDPALLKRLDFVLADTMIMGVTAEGKPLRLWLPGVTVDDPEAWMKEYLAHNLRILGEPVSILANPTYLPPCISNRYDQLWTDDRMRQVIAKAVAKGVALEVQAGSAYPKPRFLKLAKSMGAKFSFGTNNFDDKTKDLSRWLEAIERLDLRPADLWTPAKSETLASPDGAVQATVALRDGQPVLSLAYKGAAVLAPSALGLALKDGFRGGFTLRDASRATVSGEWKPVWGERASIPDRHADLTLTLQEQDPRGLKLVLELRAYNEGFALRYRLPFAADAAWQIDGEATEFRFPQGSAAFAIKGTEDTFPQEPVPLTELPKAVMAPFTVRLPGGQYASVLEAYVVRYPRCMIEKREAGAAGIRLQGRAEGRGDFTTPWRAVLLGDNEARLIENEHLTLNLNPPCALADTSWIKPGLTISDQNNCLLKMPELTHAIDVVYSNNFRYIQLDWGWYGTEWTWTDADRKKFLEVNPSWASDLAWVTNTYANPYAVAKGRVPYRPDWKDFHTVVDLDLPKLVAYARERGMGVCLYMHGDVLRAHDMDKLFATYASWGLAGLKPGFVRYGSAEQSDWIRSLVEAAARHRLWLCVHDAHVPDGMERTYPNLMINEGGGGQEGNHPVRQDVVLPFTRGLAGGFDYTPMLYAKGKSHAHGIAFPVVYRGPTTVVRSGIKELSSTGPNRFGPELEFLKRLPMNWDETRVLDAQVAHHIVTARRAGQAWFVGGMTGAAPYTAPVALDFLAPGQAYTATIFRDGDTEAGGFRPAVQETRAVKAGDRLDLPMAAAGGLAVILEPR